MAYPVDSRGWDPRMQRIIEAAGAGDDDELFHDSPFGHPAVQPKQAPPTFSRHFSNGSSLQDMLAYQAPSSAHSSSSRHPVQPMQPAQADYLVEQPYSKHGKLCSLLSTANPGQVSRDKLSNLPSCQQEQSKETLPQRQDCP